MSLSETSHLVTHRNGRFAQCLITICERHDREDAHKISRRIVKAGGATISAIAKIPFIPISLKLGPVLGPIGVVGNVAGFFILEYWAAAGAADDLLGPKIQAEKELFHEETTDKRKTCRTVVIISVASLIALASQLPTAFAGAVYNDPQYKVLAGVVLLIAGALIPIRSLQLSIEQIRIIYRERARYKITKIKAKMVALLKENHEAFIKKDLIAKRTFIQNNGQIRNLQGITEKISHYSLLMFQTDVAPIKFVQKAVTTGCHYAGFALGASLAGIFEYALGEYTYGISKQLIWDNDIAGGVLATLVVGSTVYLFGKSIPTTTQRIFRFFGNAATGQETRNLGWQLRPKLSLALTSLGLLIDVCAIGPTYVIWGDFYNQNEIKHQLFRDTMCASIFLLLFTSTLDIIDEIVTSSISHGSEEEIEIVKINEEFQRLAALVEKSPSQEFIEYLTNLDPPTLNQLLERIGIQANELNEYIHDLPRDPILSDSSMSLIN